MSNKKKKQKTYNVKFKSPSYREWYSTTHLRTEYPHLDKLLSSNRDRLRLYLMTTLETLQHGTPYSHGFVSERYLAKILNKTNAHANKILNFFCVLGILTKKRQGRLEYEHLGDVGSFAITYAIAYRNKRALREIEERAAVILKNKLTVSAMSWEAVRNCFGEELANEIYREKHERGVIPQMFETAFHDALERLTKERGWTTKEELLTDVTSWAGEGKSVTERRFGELKPALNDLGYAYKRTSKNDALAVTYELPIGRYLIFRKQKEEPSP